MIFSLLSALFWSLFDVARKELANKLDPKFISLAMSISVLPIFFCLWLIQGSELPSSNYYIPATISGVLAAIGSVCFMQAIAKGKLAVVLSITACTPFIAAIVSYLFLGELLSLLEWSGIILVVIATWLLAGKAITNNDKSSVFAFATAIAWGTCIVFDKLALKQAISSFHGLYLTSIIIFALLLSMKVKHQWGELVSNSKWWLVAVIAFFAAVFLQFTALEYLNPGVVEAIKRGLGIVIAVLIGRFCYQEALLTRQKLGVVIVLLATVIFV